MIQQLFALPQNREGNAERPADQFSLLISHRRTIMDSLWLALYWTGPIGVGAFLAGLGVLFWGIGQLRKKT
jgi:hypothetical protein